MTLFVNILLNNEGKLLWLPIQANYFISWVNIYRQVKLAS